MKKATILAGIFLLAALLPLGSEGVENVCENRIDVPNPDAPIYGTEHLFIENKGQFPDCLDYLGFTSYGYIGISKDSVFHYLIDDTGELILLNMEMVDGRASDLINEGSRPTTYNYLLGSDPNGWITGVKAYEEVILKNVWNGVDIIYRNSDKGLKYDIELRPEAKLDDVRFRVNGPASIEENEGELRMNIGTSTLNDGNLVSYDSRGEIIPSSIEILDGNAYSFDLPTWDGASKVTIDPLVYATYLGGSSWDQCLDSVMDQDGYIYMTGATMSTDLPTVPGSYSMEHNGSSDAFVAKMDDRGHGPVYLTYIGGEDYDIARGIKIDPLGSIYVCGSTDSEDFPTTDGSLHESYLGGGDDAFLVKLSDDGSTLEMSTYIGGSGEDNAYSLDMSSNGDIVVVGDTNSTDMETTPGVFRGYPRGKYDMFVMRINGSERVFSTYVGGTDYDCARKVVLDEHDNPVICGFTLSNFPYSRSAYQTKNKGGHDAVVLKMKSDGTSLIYSTHIGGSESDCAYDLELDNDGLPYVVGYTLSDDFPVVKPCHDHIHNSDSEAFVIKIATKAVDLVYSTLVGNKSETIASEIELMDDQLYISGVMNSPYLPGDGRGYDTVNDGCSDGYVVQLSKNLSEIEYSTYYGGPSSEHVWGLHVKNNTHLTITGYTGSMQIHLKENAYQSYSKGSHEMFLATIDTRTVPSEPLNISTEPGLSWVNLEWQGPIDTGGYPVDYYEIYKSTAPGEEDLYKVIRGFRSFKDNEIIMGMDYYYYVVAVNQMGRGLRSPEIYFTLPGSCTSPSGLKAEPFDSSIEITWDHSEFTTGITLLGYDVYIREENGDFEFLAHVGNDENSYIIDDLVNGREYGFYVMGITDMGDTQRSNIASAVPMTTPLPPRNLTAEVEEYKIKLTWKPPSEDGGRPIESYHIFRSRQDGKDICISAVGSEVTTFVDDEIIAGERYFYKARAVTMFGISNMSNEVSQMVVYPPVEPSIPTCSLENGGVLIRWGQPVATGGFPILQYNIFRGVDDHELNLFQEVSGEDLRYVDDMVSPGHVYTYQLSAETWHGESNRTEPMSVAITDLPTSPVNLRGSAGDGYVHIEWGPPIYDGLSDVDEYPLQRSVNGGDFRDHKVMDGSLHSFNDTEVENGNTYSYRVAAVNEKGVSPYTGIIKFRPMGAPSIPRYVWIKSSPTAVTLGWVPPVSDGGSDYIEYVVYKGESEEELKQTIEVGSDTRLVDGNVRLGKRYYYSIVAVGEIHSSEATLPLSTIPLDAPLPPENVLALPTSGNVNLQWDPPVDDGGAEILFYRIFRSNGSDEFFEIGETSGNMTTYVDKTVTGPVYYNYYVVAVNEKGPGTKSYIETVYVGGESSRYDNQDQNYDMQLLIIALASFILVAVLLLLLMLRKAVISPARDTGYRDPEYPMVPPVGRAWQGEDPALPEAEMLDD